MNSRYLRAAVCLAAALALAACGETAHTDPNPLPDAGTEPGDAGHEPVDGGHDPVDGGTEPVDGGTEPVDGGTEPIPTTGLPNYVGSDSCSTCHATATGHWAQSNHVDKARKGPAFGAEYTANIWDWVQTGWEGYETYVILDQLDSKTLYVGTRKIPLEEVAVVVGQNRKQRYAIYYDGGPVEAWLATTADEGISFTLDKSTTVEFPGNKQRAGYNFLFMEMLANNQQPAAANYGEHRSWQERCIGCHTTGFDSASWAQAKADFVAGEREHLRDLFVADMRVGCEACHGPGKAHVAGPTAANIVNPAKISDKETRKMVCEQCHTRTQSNLHHAGANDLRGFVLGVTKYTDVARYSRPAWGSGNRQFSIDGKARRDHQMDMEMRLLDHAKGSPSYHGGQACFDCHDSHRAGNMTAVNGTYSLKQAPAQSCSTCHPTNWQTLLDATKNARAGWSSYGYGNWTNEGARTSRGHMFRLNQDGLTYGLAPDQYIWSLKLNTDATVKANWDPIWPWERSLYEAQGRSVEIGATPWQ
jgi:hypothetical protein